MGWDYIHEEYQPADKANYWASDRWQFIEVQLESQKKPIKLTRKEWRLLQGFLAKHEHEAEKILPSMYEGFSPAIVKVLEDWLKHRH